MTQHETSRRQFLGVTGAAALGAWGIPNGPWWALPAEARKTPALAPKEPTLVCVYLRGGADPLNIVVPYTNKVYYDVRPTIAIPAETTAESPGVLKLNDNYGLHPALAPLKKFWDQQRLAAILNIGSPHDTRSHFDAQDFMEYAAPGDRTITDGWLNRFLQATKSPKDSPLRALAMQGLLPRSLRGKEPVLAVPKLRSGESEGLLDLFDDVYKTGASMTGDLGAKTMDMERRDDAGREAAVNVGRHTIETLRHFWEIVERPANDDTKAVSYPRGLFAERLGLVAKVIKNGGNLSIACLDVPSWDHHQGEGSTDGSMQRQLTALGEGLGAFFEDLGPRSDGVMVLVMTEFGRTVAENGNRGTDHGRGSAMLALGGPVQGGIFGDYGTLLGKDLQDGRDLKVDLDFRSAFAESLKGAFGFEPPKGFFPNWSLKGRDPIGFVRA